MLGWEKYKIFERTKERSLRCGKTPFICTRARRKNALTLVEAVKARSRKFFFFNCWSLWEQRRIITISEARKIGGRGSGKSGWPLIQLIKERCSSSDPKLTVGIKIHFATKEWKCMV